MRFVKRYCFNDEPAGFNRITAFEVIDDLVQLHRVPKSIYQTLRPRRHILYDRHQRFRPEIKMKHLLLKHYIRLPVSLVRICLARYPGRFWPYMKKLKSPGGSRRRRFPQYGTGRKEEDILNSYYISIKN